MKLADLDYALPSELIAQHPIDRRDESRLLVVNRARGAFRDEVFSRLPDLLPPSSLLVLNDTKVLPARLRLRRVTGGRFQGLFLRETEPHCWELMVTSGRRLRTGELLELEPGGQQLKLLQRMGEGVWRAAPVPPEPAESILARYGSAPLPPYIHRDQRAESSRATGGLPASAEPVQPPCVSAGLSASAETGGQAADDLERYQTIYAARAGAVAAPTAGLHFTPSLMERLAAAKIRTEFVTLHVGVGTFAPIRVDDLAQHRMHSEYYECPAQTAEAVNAARAAGRVIVAVGTTSVRVLETCADEQGKIAAGSGWTDIFIYPPYRYRAVDQLITNFHLPGSTLLALVFAFAGRELTREAYAHAIKQRYRFYSYGDAMLIQ